MASRSLLHEAGELNGARKFGLRITRIAPGQAVRFGLIMIHANQPLRTVGHRRQHICASRERHGSAIDAGLRIDAQWQIEWRAGAAEIAQSSQIQVEPGIAREQ